VRRHLGGSGRAKRGPASTVALALVVGLAGLAGVSPGLPAARADGITVLDDMLVPPSSRLHELTLGGTAVGPTKVRVLLPAGYDAPGTVIRYPVLLLLHGAGDDQAAWTVRGNAEAITAGRDLIVVMPDAGKGSTAGWYSDWVAGPQWETYHIGELMPLIDSRYRTVGGRDGWAVAGLSMGGYGAMIYAARHPDLFVAAAAFSGAVDNADGGPPEAIAYKALHDQFGTPDDNVWGEYSTDEVRWRAHNPVDLDTNLSSLGTLILITGNGVPMPSDRAQDAPTEAGVYSQNIQFHTRMTVDGIDHTWHDRGYGTHAWNYWQNALRDTLDPFMVTFANPPDRLAPFDYRSAEPSFSVWGWTFAARAPRPREFLDLHTVTPNGLTATGSGTIDVVSPPGRYLAGVTYQIWENRDGSLAPSTAVAGLDGSLRFTVDLGPPHAHQEYTPDARLAEIAAAGRYWVTTSVSIAPTTG
jgi:S-formylglutathione hydrolase FrmB